MSIGKLLMLSLSNVPNQRQLSTQTVQANAVITVRYVDALTALTVSYSSPAELLVL